MEARRSRRIDHVEVADAALLGAVRRCLACAGTIGVAGGRVGGRFPNQGSSGVRGARAEEQPSAVAARRDALRLEHALQRAQLSS